MTIIRWVIGLFDLPAYLMYFQDRNIISRYNQHGYSFFISPYTLSKIFLKTNVLNVKKGDT